MTTAVTSIDQVVTLSGFADDYFQGMADEHYEYNVESRNAFRQPNMKTGLFAVTVSKDSATANPIKSLYTMANSNRNVYMAMVASNKSAFSGIFKGKARNIVQSLTVRDTY